MKKAIAHAAVAFTLAAGLAGCYVYDPYYPPPVSPQAAFDRYFGAALGAMRDQRLDITAENRASGVIEGRRGGIVMRANVIPQADGRVRVEFNASGAISEDPSLPDRVSRAYDARLGR